MNLRKWMKLFGMTLLIGAIVTVIGSICIQLSNPDFRNVEASGWVSYILMMALIGMTFGAFSHMGFFAYLMLNYIARSIFKRPYSWVAIQGFIALFVLAEIAYWTYDTNFPNYTYWAIPLGITLASIFVAWRKVNQTSSGAWIPTIFFLVAITVMESIPVFKTADISSLLYQMVPLFICNAYQIMQLHRILGKAPSATPSAAAI
ncbi:KinB-signaling pathway activation protein [Cohnella silvisoli]|uniref:KinB-signaling pathway activation protein n=1 Tax=Cohnella silvisoli TaxID=2873699 RepID=A0ABV1L3X5_9BACL|nr:KinB-signaling pathway activation protein [Cohnella silvisoli]MCD9026399.1 KinB-signaling pathway activation protein [Cohnella silvisoli]